MTEIRIEITGVNELYKKMAGLKGFFQSRELRVVLEEGKNRIVRLARDAAPRKSRFLTRSIDGRVENFGTDNPAIRVGSTSRYAPYVEYSTKPHPIVPRNRKSLFWVMYNTPQTASKFQGTSEAGVDRSKAGAVFRFARKVDHPGTRAQPFMEPAFQAVKPRLILALERAVATKLRGT